MEKNNISLILEKFKKEETKSLELESNEMNSCKLCNGELEFSEENFLTCTNPKCAIIFNNNLDNSPEWRYYGADDSGMSDPTRCGMPINPLLKESSYGCKVICNKNQSYEMRKIRKYTEWQSMPYKEKSQYDEFERIKLLGQNSDIPKIIIDEALRIHKKLSYEQNFRGLNRQGLIAASVYISSKVHNLPRTPKEIAEIFHLDSSSTTKGCKNAIIIINKLENYNINSDKTYFYETKPLSFIERYCSKLNISTELTKLAKFIAIQLESKNIMPENTPHSIASGIIYFICYIGKLKITKQDVRLISNTSEVTINKVFKKLQENTNILVPKIILEKY